MIDTILKDLRRYSEINSFRSNLKTIIISFGFLAVVIFRIQSYFFKKGLILLSYLIHHVNCIVTGADILPGCTIGPGLRIDHPTGIVIGAGVKIGDNCTILQGVTLGVKNVNPVKNDHQYPEIGDDVVLGPKSSIFGGVKIGSGTFVGAHAVVIASAPEGSLLIGIPAKNLNSN
jgi:serine O-acetyltransferase